MIMMNINGTEGGISSDTLPLPLLPPFLTTMITMMMVMMVMAITSIYEITKQGQIYLSDSRRKNSLQTRRISQPTERQSRKSRTRESTSQKGMLFTLFHSIFFSLSLPSSASLSIYLSLGPSVKGCATNAPPLIAVVMSWIPRLAFICEKSLLALSCSSRVFLQILQFSSLRFLLSALVKQRAISPSVVPDTFCCPTAFFQLFA